LKRRIAHPTFNNPHNIRISYDGRWAFQAEWHSDVIHKIDVAAGEVLQTRMLASAPRLEPLIKKFPGRVGIAPAHVFTHPHHDLRYVTLNNDAYVMVRVGERRQVSDGIIGHRDRGAIERTRAVGIGTLRLNAAMEVGVLVRCDVVQRVGDFEQIPPPRRKHIA
jgi:hypothetical protein